MSRWPPLPPLPINPPRPRAEILRAEMRRLVSGPVMFNRLPPRVAGHLIEVQQGGKPWDDCLNYNGNQMWRDDHGKTNT